MLFRSLVMCFDPGNGKLSEIEFPEDSIAVAYDILAVDNNIMYVTGKDKTGETLVISMDLATTEVVMYQKGPVISVNS